MSEFERGQVGQRAEHLITKMQDSQSGDPAIGNVLRRTCESYSNLGKEACKQACRLYPEYDNYDFDTTARELISSAIEDRSCSDINLNGAFERLEIPQSEVLMIGVTANVVGYADKLDEYKVQQNPYGWRELAGFNAFFAREGEVGALGRRLADCADINFEFKDSDGNTVIGFEHGTRTNMFGESKHQFERGGRSVSFTEYVLGQAIEHYGAEPDSVHIKLAAAIKGHNFTKHFDSKEKMEGHIPGWYEAGYVKNVSHPEWTEGDPIVESDTWEADSRGMILDDIQKAMSSIGVPAENFSADGIIDPGDTKGEHSSHEFRNEYGDTRDLYMTYIPQDHS